MARGASVTLGEVHEAPMPVVRAEDCKLALSQCECKGVARSHDLAVKISARALAAIEQAAASVAPLSCAGALLGTVYQVGETWLVDIGEALPLNATPEMHRVRVPRHAWQEMLRERKNSFSDMRVVGWYHSHSGIGASFSDADAFVHRYFFPADWQVACVVDAQRRETQFFSRRGRSMSALGAYWVERGAGWKSAAPAREEAVPRPERAEKKPSGHNGGGSRMPVQESFDEAAPPNEMYLKERFVERSLEKILRLLKEPPMTLRDFVMIGFMALLLALLIITRTGSSSGVDFSQVNDRLDKIEARLAEMQTGRVNPGMAVHPPAAPQGRPSTAAAADSPVATAVTKKAPQSGAEDTEHVMAQGETLWSVAEQYYGDGALMNALMRYNKIADARDLRVGAKIKIPSEHKLAELAPAPPGVTTRRAVSAPPPTPH